MMLHGGHSHRIGREVYCSQHTVGSTCWWYTLPSMCCQAYTCFQQNCINVQWLLSQSWLDSICRDSTDTQYMTKQTLNLKNAKLILYNSVPFIVECFHNEQHAQWCEKYQTRKSPGDQNVFLSSCSDWLVQTVCMIVFAQTAAFYTEQCSSPSLFTWSLTRWFELVTEELWLHLRRHFFTCTHVYKSLGNKTIHYSRLLN